MASLSAVSPHGAYQFCSHGLRRPCNLTRAAQHVIKRAGHGGVVMVVDEESSKRHVVITGANTGIGKATAIELARLGMTVTLACRDKEKGLKAAAEIADLTKNASVRAMVCDLASLQSVRRFAEECKASNLPLHVLINNAGVMACPQAYTEDGFEQQLGVNHLGHFLLTGLLLDTLTTSASSKFPPRVVVLASAIEILGRIDFDDLNFTGSRDYQPWLAYAQSKLANVLFAFELGRRCKAQKLPITCNCMHPGIVATELARYLLPRGMMSVPRFLQEVMLNVLPIRSAAEGASTAIYLATSPAMGGRSVGYYQDCREVTPSCTAQDLGLATKLWSTSEGLTRFSYRLQPTASTSNQVMIS